MDIGEVVDGRYELQTRLGTGATAEVYRARDLELDRVVAIKVFGPASELSDTGRRLREARSLAALRHPAVVAIHDARLDHEPPYLVLEHVHGRSLADALATGPLDADRTRAIGAAAAAGLAAAHDLGIVHRDVKPANILLPEGDGDLPARLLDFGIAYSLGDPRRTTAGSVLGSATYLSPEQARGDEVGPASDVYSLGLVLIECLTGSAAFPGSTPEAVAARLVSAPSLAHPALAADAPLLARMTAREAADRPDAAEVAELLGAPADVVGSDAPALAPTKLLPAATAATERFAPDADVPTQRHDPTGLRTAGGLGAATAGAAPRAPRRRPVGRPALGARTRAVLAAAGLGLLALVGALTISGFTAPTIPTESTVTTPEPTTPAEEPVEPAEPPAGPGNGNGPGNNGNGNGPGGKHGPKDD